MLPAENLTMTQTELDACRPVSCNGGRRLRAFCPVHGSDHQRSLSVDTETGRFVCFACGTWGYLAEKRRVSPRSSSRFFTPATPRVRTPAVRPQPPARDDLRVTLRAFQQALPGSWGEEYLGRRGIPLDLALRFCVGYAATGTWPNGKRDWRWGRVVFPHTTPDGQVVNLYGRAVGADAKVPKEVRHDHLPGTKGWFNASALRDAEGPLYVCEGAFDALALIAAGFPRTIAIFGLDGWRWDWLPPSVTDIAFCLDQDPPATDGTPARSTLVMQELARAAVLRGKRAWLVPSSAFGSDKDAAAAWESGQLRTELLHITQSHTKRTPPESDSHFSLMPLHIEEAMPTVVVESCFSCGGQRWWHLSTGPWTCGVCHPPANPAAIWYNALRPVVTELEATTAGGHDLSALNSVQHG